MLLRLNDKNIDTDTILKIVKCLKDGGIIIYPTDTVYALGCDITNNKAVERILYIVDCVRNPIGEEVGDIREDRLGGVFPKAGE